MATVILPPRHYLNDGYGIASWLFTRDHKRIALLYLAGVTFFFFIGGAFAVLIRLELATPVGDLVTDETYNKLFTMHGVMMVFFFLDPGHPVRPRELSRADHDWREGPRVSEAESRELVHLHGRRGVHLYAIVTGGVDTGWTFYTPFSTVSSTSQVVPDRARRYS